MSLSALFLLLRTSLLGGGGEDASEELSEEVSKETVESWTAVAEI